MSWATVINQVTSDYVTLNEAYNQSKIVEINAKLNETIAGIRADQLGRQATMMENIGVRQAQIAQYEGRKAESDAIAAMAASGGTVDPAVIARFKQRTRYNATAAVFDARMKALDTRFEAGMTRIGAKMHSANAALESSAIWREAVTGVATNALQMWGGTLSQRPQLPARPVAGASFTRVNNARGFVGGF